jgi:tetratricopeptide (TPR) repeat protein
MKLSNYRSTRRPGWLTLAGILVLLTACGQGAKATQPQQSDAQKASILLQSGMMAHKSGRLAEAAKDYQKALVYDPKNEWAHYNLGLIEQLQGQNAAAVTDYRAALVMDPTLVSAMYNLAILRSGSAPDEAIDLYRHAIAVQPDMALAHLNLGFLLLAQGQQAEATAEFNQAVKLDPNLKGRVPHSPAPAPSKKP